MIANCCIIIVLDLYFNYYSSSDEEQRWNIIKHESCQMTLSVMQSQELFAAKKQRNKNWFAFAPGQY